MSDWEKIELRCLFDISIAGEWGDAPDGLNDTYVLRAADFTKDCKLKSNIGAPRVIQASKLIQRRLKKGDLLLEKSGGSPDQPVGRVVYFDRNGDNYTLSNFLQLLRANKNFDSLWAYYLLTGLYDSNVVLRYQQQTTGIINFKLEEYLSENVVIPLEVGEQQKIAKILSTVDKLIEKTQSLIDKYSAIKQGMMADLFTRGIDMTTGPNHGKLRPSVEAAPELYKQSELGWIPKEWEVRNLGELAEKVTSGSRDWAAYYADEGDLFVRISNLTREHINFRWKSMRYVDIGNGSEGERTRLEAGDILISITADLGIIGVVPNDFGRAFINQHTALVRLEKEVANPRYVGNFLHSYAGQLQFEKFNDSGAKAGLNLPTVASLSCILPSLNEQGLISAGIDSIDTQVETYKIELAKYQAQKKGLMQDLLTGKVKV